MIAGDLFDKYKVSPETVNRAIHAFRAFDQPVYAIPGQHDLPYHVYADIERSSYWTLVTAGVIKHLHCLKPHEIVSQDGCQKIRLHAFPWGTPIEAPLVDYGSKRKGAIAYDVAVCHQYVWQDEQSWYQGVSEEKMISRMKNKLKGYDFAVFGDNHKHFTDVVQGRTWKCQVINHGGFIKRKSDERHEQINFGVIHADGKLRAHSLQANMDWEVKLVDSQETNEALEEFMELYNRRRS